MIKVKICGITTLEDALVAAEAGADALGFVFYNGSSRCIRPDDAAAIIRQLPPFVQAVGLFVNEELKIIHDITSRCGLDIIQLHGEESPEFCAAIPRRVLKAFRVRDAASLAQLRDYRTSAFLLDAWSPIAHGGTGCTFNWDIAANASKSSRIVLAGGLNPDNVAQAVCQVSPYAVDVSSGVESAPGQKDAALVRQFVRKAKEASLEAAR